MKKTIAVIVTAAVMLGGTCIGAEGFTAGDANHDGKLTQADIDSFTEFYLNTADGEYDAVYDMNGDGFIDGDDYDLLVKAVEEAEGEEQTEGLMEKIIDEIISLLNRIIEKLTAIRTLIA